MGCTLGVLLVVAVGFADEKIDAKKLIGKWQPTSTKENVIIEFTKDGKLSLSAPDPAGKTEKTEGTYKLDGNKLSVAVKFMDAEEKQDVTITKLTDDELETEFTDKDGKVKKETLKRVK
jgi:uncharacterized protein (TIGR03066 family)